MPPVKLHRCPLTFIHHDADSCWRVQRALDEQGIEYEIVKEPLYPRGRRKEIKEMTDQVYLPVIQFEDGTSYRAESKEMASRIRAGELFS
ncbi:MAG: glutathione S-transferase domain-containing protein [Solirubrobacteraceae bacterium]|nr:glutathione S-transferase domain-containing protein [Solirubrobacteraceae bacterium]